ncbi:hypothetical protein D9M70_518250 [compost metagenome]
MQHRHPLLDLVQLLRQRLAQRRQALALVGLGAALVLAVDRGGLIAAFAILCQVRGRGGIALGGGLLQQPVAVVVQVPVEGLDGAVGDQHELVGGGAQQVAVVRDRAFELRQRHGQRLAGIEVEVVGRFVEQQQVGLLPDDQRQRQPRLFAAGERLDR